MTAPIWTNRYQRAEELPFQTLQDELVVLVPREWMHHLIEGVGVDIWEYLQQPHAGDEILAMVLENFEVPEATARRDVEQFLTLMVERKLIRVVTPA